MTPTLTVHSQPLTIITKCSILDVAAVIDPPLLVFMFNSDFYASLRHFTFLSTFLYLTDITFLKTFTVPRWTLF